VILVVVVEDGMRGIVVDAAFLQKRTTAILIYYFLIRVGDNRKQPKSNDRTRREAGPRTKTIGCSTGIDSLKWID
jgi:hypothetical protein